MAACDALRQLSDENKKAPPFYRRGPRSKLIAGGLCHPPTFVHVAAIVIEVGVEFIVANLGGHCTNVVVEHQHNLPAIIMHKLLAFSILGSTRSTE